MRKYIQLLLIVTVVTSLSLMILYERKYYKVKMVLELLNAFSSKDPVKSHSLTRSKMDSRIEESLLWTSWSHVTTSLYLYSAFWDNGGKSDRSAVVLLASILQQSELTALNCFLWYRNEISPIKGILQVVNYEGNSSSFFIRCLTVGSTVPYGITLSLKSINSSFIPVTSFQPQRKKLVSCMEPLPTGFKNIAILAEYLILHQNLGVNHFIFYDKGISPQARQFLRYAKSVGYNLDVLHWNYPNSLIETDAHKLDCFGRAFLSHNASNVAILRLYHFFVPKVQNLTDILKIPTISEYRFTYFRFCSEFPVDVVAATLNFPFVTLRYTKRLKREETLQFIYGQSDFFVWRTDWKKGEIELVSRQQFVVHVYGKCHLPLDQLSKKKYVVDTSMISYKGSLFSSSLYGYLDL